MPVSDVTAGIRLLIEVLSEPGPVVVPTPAYPPQLDLPAIAGRELVTVPLSPDADEAALDVDGIEAALSEGARTVVLTQPHNPLGRVYRREELEALRDVVVRHGARVVSDEVHAPLVLPGAEHVPYLSLPGTADHAVAVVAASKAFNIAGLRCAQMVSNGPGDARPAVSQPLARNDAWSSIGVRASIASSTTETPGWPPLVERLVAQRALLGQLLAEHLPPRPYPSVGGDVPGLVGPARVRRGRPGGRGAAEGPREAGSWPRLPAGARPGTCGSTSRRRPPASPRSVRRLASALP